MQKTWHALLAMFAIVGCTTNKPAGREVSCEELEGLTPKAIEPKYAQWGYRGYDAEFHYFEWQDLDAIFSVKVRRDTATVPNPFPYSEDMRLTLWPVKSRAEKWPVGCPLTRR